MTEGLTTAAPPEAADAAWLEEWRYISTYCHQFTWWFQTHLLESFDLQPLVIEEDFDIFDCTRHIIHPLHEQTVCIVIDTGHAESSQIGCEGDFGILFAFLIFCDLLSDSSPETCLWGPFLAHVFGKDLSVLLPIDLVGGFNDCN
jgi:hypothetical protein